MVRGRQVATPFSKEKLLVVQSGPKGKCDVMVGGKMEVAVNVHRSEYSSKGWKSWPEAQIGLKTVQGLRGGKDCSLELAMVTAMAQ